MEKESKLMVKYENYTAMLDGYAYKIEIDDEKKYVWLGREDWATSKSPLCINAPFDEIIALREVLSDVVRRIWTHEQE